MALVLVNSQSSYRVAAKSVTKLQIQEDPPPHTHLPLCDIKQDVWPLPGQQRRAGGSSHIQIYHCLHMGRKICQVKGREGKQLELPPLSFSLGNQPRVSARDDLKIFERQA